MSRVFFAGELDTAAAWWRVFRRDGVALGFTTHDRDLWFDGLLHRAAPGMLPSAIRRTIGFEDDESEVEGALTHDSIRAADLSAGLFDGARVVSGIVDWETFERAMLYGGSIGAIAQEGGSFSAQLHSAKADLAVDIVPVSSPTCRARFCGPGCALAPAAFERVSRIVAVDRARNRLTLDLASHEDYALGELRLMGGARTGMTMRILDADSTSVTVDSPIEDSLMVGVQVRIREGCDRTIASCADRFDNAHNFRGEPFLPGNDLLAQYPIPR
ncbi:DUF2163 domain-containing protein [Qipengyuania sp. XHP0207]|uniref:DUF2163 domain-containing protein n=1 Tax=Qipengyuania sp. XHP0207 TaxID=3038078 RepID=UPI00241C15ED|nr:DUF2163 domain-containing protein [Qipengyuania sp. XHP0207]MDG5748241.1 DUF2163 domain-containing protein [Qipengyuania sp. XHP0207]